MTNLATQPTEIDLDRGRGLRIRWADGHVCAYPLAVLRKACPCAGCRSEREQVPSAGLPVTRSAREQEDMTTVVSAELVGQYAIRLTWADGHSTGIYDYELLRALCPEPRGTAMKGCE
ncbi:MAG: DUF971 domain-containing protein [Planctomycetota bacterium]